MLPFDTAYVIGIKEIQVYLRCDSLSDDRAVQLSKALCFIMIWPMWCISRHHYATSKILKKKHFYNFSPDIRSFTCFVCLVKVQLIL